LGSKDADRLGKQSMKVPLIEDGSRTSAIIKRAMEEYGHGPTIGDKQNPLT
jgi:hypothetical protein